MAWTLGQRWPLLACVACLLLACKSSDKTAQTPPAAKTLPRDAAVDAKAIAKPRRTVITSIAIVPEHPARKLEIYPERLAKQLGTQLTGTQWFGSAGGTLPDGFAARPGTVRVDLKYDFRIDKRSKVMITAVAVDAQVQWADGGTTLMPREKVLLERSMTKKQRTMDASEHVAEQIAHAVKIAGLGLIKKAELLEADRDRLLIVMGGLDDEVVTWALAVASSRKVKSLFTTVVGLLKSKSRRVREAAVGYLIELGDPRAVAHLTKLSEFRDHRSLRIIIDAVASLGGQEAVEFLEFVASGHNDAEIRKQAQQAMKRMKRGSSKLQPQ